ncbi:MAG: flagellar hook-associated protein FlgK [Gammaproteobacteria bacterium]
MAGPDIFGIGTSALSSFQRAIATTGHNIANVNTEGYSRQRVELTQRTPQFTGAGWVGSGTEVVTTERLYSEFLTREIRSGTTNFHQLETFYKYASQLDRLLADQDSGLQPTLDGFFNAMQELADYPSSQAVRQTVLSEAEALASRFNSLSRQLDGIRQSSDLQIRTTVEEINGLADSIAALNERIVAVQGSGHTPNDLLDQRDELLRRLSERVSVTSLEQSDGAVNVFIGNGLNLVVGNQTNSLSVIPNNFDASRLDVAIDLGSTSVRITDQISGGALGGLYQFQNGILGEAYNELGLIAIGLADTFNAQHQLGQDLQGNLGGLFFNDIAASSPATFAGTTNTGTGVIDADITDVNALTASDYELSFDGALYTLTRLSDNTTVATNASLAALSGDGLSFSLVSGAIAANDRFLIQPTRNGANDLAVTVATTNEIAAAAPIRTAAATTNSGSAVISAGVVNGPPPTDPNLQQTVTITFNNPPTTFDVTGTGTGNPAGVAYTSGGSISYNGWTIEISGTPAAGDVFTIEANAGGVGDNRNALLLGELRTRNTLNNGTATFQTRYGSFVADVGVQTHQADVSQQAQKSLLDQTISERNSLSGVNLDEEAANLLRFQQAYQAAAQVISTAGTLFDTLLGAVRR